MIILNQNISMKILPMMLKMCLSHQIIHDKRPLPRVNKKVIGLMKDELGGKIMIKLVALEPKTYSHWMDDGNEHKRAKETKNI